MTKEELKDKLEDNTETTEDIIAGLLSAMINVDDRIALTLTDKIPNFKIEDGRLVPDDNYTDKILGVRNDVQQDIFGSNSEYTQSYVKAIKDLTSASNDYTDTVYDYNKLDKDKKLVGETTKYYSNEAMLAFSDQVPYEVLSAITFLLMYHIANSSKVNELESDLSEFATGQKRPLNGRPIHNAYQHAESVIVPFAYDTKRQNSVLLNNKLKSNSFIYIGDIIKDTRPLCKHLVDLDREIRLSEMTSIIQANPQGLYPNTTKDNFISRCGGYNCRHIAVPIF